MIVKIEKCLDRLKQKPIKLTQSGFIWICCQKMTAIIIPRYGEGSADGKRAKPIRPNTAKACAITVQGLLPTAFIKNDAVISVKSWVIKLMAMSRLMLPSVRPYSF